VRAVVSTAPGAGPAFFRLSPPARGPVGQILGARVPSLLNSPGLTSIGGVAVGIPYFNENMPLRGDKPVFQNNRDIPGAVAIQQVLERAEWATVPGGAAAFAPYLRTSPLDAAGPRRVLVQVSRGDQNVEGPAAAAM